MKTQLLLFALISLTFTNQIEGQNRTIVNAQSSEISDNLDLRVVASIFGDSRNLQDFERQINDPKLQISNLDLNNDGQVDYLRVIESVEKRKHFVIVQAVLDRDIYQDVASIEVEKDRNNNIQIQVVGNSFFYGQNYIYEPLYYSRPLIYNSFWISNYQPYCSNWNWNYYPSYFVSWNSNPVFRYRNNVNICLSRYSNNHYNYVNNRRFTYSENSFNSNRSNAYERQYPENSFSRRNATVNNRYELDQNRGSRNNIVRSEITNSQRINTQRDYTQTRSESPREIAPQRTNTPRDYSQTRSETQREIAPQRTNTPRDYSQTRSETQREIAPQRTNTPRDYSQTRSETQREIAPQRSNNQRDYSQNRSEAPREIAPQRTDSQRDNSSSRGTSSDNNSNSSRGGGRRI